MRARTLLGEMPELGCAKAVLAIGADQGSIPDMAGPLMPFCENIRGVIIANSGHFIPEEQPHVLADELATFFG